MDQKRSPNRLPLWHRPAVLRVFVMQQLVHWAVLFVMFPVILSGCGDSDERAYTVGWFPPIVDESDCSNGYCLIPAGTFQMGSPDSESDRQGDEGPVHSVTITRSFLMRQTEVTQLEWKSLMGNNPSYFRSCGDRCPVEGVNWYDAVYYANALSKAEGFETCYTIGVQVLLVMTLMIAVTFMLVAGYRLPPKQNGSIPLELVLFKVWAVANNMYSLTVKLLINYPKGPNAWGLYDMLGVCGVGERQVRCQLLQCLLIRLCRPHRTIDRLCPGLSRRFLLQLRLARAGGSSRQQRSPLPQRLRRVPRRQIGALDPWPCAPNPAPHQKPACVRLRSVR